MFFNLRSSRKSWTVKFFWPQVEGWLFLRILRAGLTIFVQLFLWSCGAKKGVTGNRVWTSNMETWKHRGVFKSRSIYFLNARLRLLWKPLVMENEPNSVVSSYLLFISWFWNVQGLFNFGLLLICWCWAAHRLCPCYTMSLCLSLGIYSDIYTVHNIFSTYMSKCLSYWSFLWGCQGLLLSALTH